MKIINFKHQGTWRDVADSARTTVGLENGEGEPSDKWKKKILLAEHSPIRELVFKWEWIDIPSWVSVHFVRHKIGIEHFVSTQRNDRTKVDRDKSTQDTIVSHYFEANAQAIINISRKRLCTQAHKETREKWIEFLDKEVKEKEPELYSVCVSECIYRGFCPEFTCCGFVNTDKCKKELIDYRNTRL